MRTGRLALVLLLFPSICFGQAWSGIIDSTRAADWSLVGVIGDVPSASWTNCTAAACNTLNGGTVTATSIANALAACGTNEVVRIPAGSYSVAAFNHTKSNCALRGAGGTATILTLTSDQSGAGLGGTLSANVHMMSGTTATAAFGGVNTATWTAVSYAQGQTTITMSSTANMMAGAIGTGTLLFLDQLNDSADGYPATGDLYVCDDDLNNCSNKGDGNHFGRSGRAQVEAVTVVGISGSTVTISPGLTMPNWRAAKTPGAWWVPTTAPLTNAGLENLTIDFTASGDIGFMIANAVNCWTKGVRIINTSTNSDAAVYHMWTFQSAHITVRSNYFYGKISTGSSPLENYAYTNKITSDVLFENNIIHHSPTGIVPNDPASRDVYSYTYVDDDYTFGESYLPHSFLDMALFEGNNIKDFYADVTHAPHFFLTLFRNHFDGLTHNQAGTTSMPIGLLTNNRFFNIIGNIIGYTTYTLYERSSNLGNLNGQADDACFTFGWKGDNSGTPVTDDNRVKTTSMRWGNWCNPSSSSPTGSNDSTGTAWTSGEVPSGITSYSNSVPASHTLPASLYLSSQPSWWGSPYGTIHYPAIGPDVSSGTATNTATSPTGGHADKITSRLCFENIGNDPAYPSSSPRIKAFDATTCYIPQVTCTPDHLTFTAQPSSATLGSSVGTVSVGIYDSGSVLCSTATNSVTLAKSAGSTYGTLTSASSLTKSASSGVATWSDPDLTITVSVGTGGITATATALTGATSNTFTITTPAGTSNAGRLWKVPIALLLVEPPPMIVYPPMKIKGENR